MTTKNPFGQLNVRRDEEDEDVTLRHQAQPTTSTTPLFTGAVQQADKKKKKVRPEEIRQIEQTTNYVQDNDVEGFSVVKKKVPGKFRSQNEEEQVVDDKLRKPKSNNGAFLDRNRQAAPGKRVFERHSGTGRGKEISKGGAGGKHTWGANPNNIARDATKRPTNDKEVYNNEDESCKLIY
jgi:hypothetical protein